MISFPFECPRAALGEARAGRVGRLPPAWMRALTRPAGAWGRGGRFVLGEEAVPALAEGFFLGRRGEAFGGIEGQIVEQQMEADAVGAMADVDDGFSVGLAAVFAGVQVEGPEEGVVVAEGGAKLEDSVAEVGVAFLGEGAVEDAVAGGLQGGMEASLGPDLIGLEEAREGEEATPVGGDEVGGGAREGEEVAGWGEGDQVGEALEGGGALLVEGVEEGEVLLDERGVDGGDLFGG